MPCRALLVGDGPVREITPDEAGRYHGPGFVWTHIDGMADEDLAPLADQEDIPEIAASALVATETRPRCERIADGALVNLRGLAVHETGDSDRLVSIRFWARAGKVNSVTRRPLAATKVVIEEVKGGSIVDPGDLVAAFARAISEQLDPEVADLGDQLDECETGLTPKRIFRLRRSIANLRSEAIAYRRFVAPDRDALLALSMLDVKWLAEEDRLHVREAADRFARMAEELEAVRERAALLHEQLTDLRSEQLDSRTLIVSIVALVFLPLTFITGLFGMNVEGIPFSHSASSFWGITAFCLAVALIGTLYFIRLRWLRRD